MMQHLLRLGISFKLTHTLELKKMDGFTEKKWFVYVGDHHEGPFSLEEVQGKMVQGDVSTESFVWAEGMTDWKPMTEMSDFAPILTSTAEAAPVVSAPDISRMMPLEAA